jgi:hypothetical protein
MIILACALVAAGCAQTNYQAYEGRGANIVEGQGGTKEVIDGYEIWDNGDPPRRYQVIGVATIEDFDNLFGNQRMRSAIPAEIKKAGGDAAIVQDGWSQGQSVGVGTAYNSKGQMSVATGQSFGRKQIRYKIVKYADGPLARVGSKDSNVASQQRAMLSKAEVEQLLVGRSHTFKGESGSLKWDVRANGELYSTNYSVSSTGVGRWELKDDGALCAIFNTGDRGCVYFFRDGNQLRRTSRNAQDDRIGTVIEVAPEGQPGS